MSDLDPVRSEALSERIRICLESGERNDPIGDDDALDDLTWAIPSAQLHSSYRQGAHRMDQILRWLCQGSGPDVLTIYGMQVRNLDRDDDEVRAFLESEAECCRGWARDEMIRKTCRFRFVGDRTAFDAHRRRSRIAPQIEEFLSATEELEEASDGGYFPVNILAPYEYDWEINQAIVNGRFDPKLLVVSDEVDLVVRSGGDRRSTTSGALPCQVAFSHSAIIGHYFPDCTVEDLQQAFQRYESRRRTPGL